MELDVHERPTMPPPDQPETLIVPAMDVVSRLRDVLAAEYEAARQADTHALVVLQEMKREALDAVSAAEVSDEEWEDVMRQARINVKLMRHLVISLRGILASAEGPTYGSAGHVQVLGAGRDHGAA